MEKPTRLEGQGRLGKIINNFYAGAHECALGKRQPIAWVSTASPVEILWAMGYECVFPEAHSASCGGRHVGDFHCQVTEARDYEMHLCTYARNDIGWVLAGDDHKSPVGGLPRPDILVCANNSCTTMQKWMENQSRYLRVPMVLIDTPYLAPGTEEKGVIDYILKQLADLIRILEKLTGRKFDGDKLREIVATGQKNSQLYQDILSLNKASLPPASMFDLFAQNFPMLCMRNTTVALEHYTLLKQELEQRVAQGIPAFPDIKYRIYWDGVPSWFALSSLSKKLSSLGICLTASNYSHLFSYKYLDAARPLESVAEGCAKFHLNRSVAYKRDFVARLFREYALDGGIFEYAETCKPFTITQSYIQEYVRTELGLPTVSFEADLTDSRFYSEEETYLRFEALAEALESRSFMERGPS